MGDNVDAVWEYKDLGNIDHKLKRNRNVSQIYKKCNQRLVSFFLVCCCSYVTLQQVSCTMINKGIVILS